MSRLTLEDHEQRIETALSRAASRLPEPVEYQTPLGELMVSEEAEQFEEMASEDEYARELLRKFFDRFFDFLFEDGPHPGWVLRRLYVLARRYKPNLILHMNGTDLGLMFGETRAAQAWRLKMIFRRLKESGVHGYRGGGSKTESSCEAYAVAATGNQNRLKGKTRKSKNQ